MQNLGEQSRSKLSQLAQEYISDARARGLSLKTIRDHYGYTLDKVFIPWCDGEGISSPTEITSRVLTRWQTEMLEKPGKRGVLISRHSVDTFVRTVNSFLAWVREQGEMEQVARGKPPTLPRRVLDVLSRDEIQKMEDHARTERDKLIVRVLADTGIRAGELLGLRRGDLIERDRNHYLLIRHRGSGGGLKGQRERLVPIPRLRRRLERLARGADPDGHIFVVLRRRPGAVERHVLTTSGLQQMIRALAAEAGITRRVYPHLLRHSYATWALSRGMNPIQVADILGHSSLAMIHETYSHLSSSDAHEAMVRLLAADDARHS